jgi:hypothetical protein
VAHIGDLGDLRFHGWGALVVSAAGKPREALLTEQDGEGVDRDDVVGGGKFPLDVIDRKIAFAHGYGQITDAIAGGGGLRSTMGLAKERGAFVGVVAEVMTKDPKGARRIAETSGNVAGGLFIDDEGAERLVLALHGELWGKEEPLVGRYHYLIHSTGLHIQIVLSKHSAVNMFWPFGPNNQQKAGSTVAKCVFG